MSDEASVSQTPPPTASVPVNWVIPETVVPQYATNFTLQRLNHEYVLSFFQIVPPLITGTPEQVAKELERFKAVEATCIFRVFIAEDRISELASLLAMGPTLAAVTVSGKVNASTPNNPEGASDPES